MLVETVVLAIGVVVIILGMAFVLNPPEAWIKRVFLSKEKR